MCVIKSFVIPYLSDSTHQTHILPSQPKKKEKKHPIDHNCWVVHKTRQIHIDVATYHTSQLKSFKIIS